jgi:redox-sensitive bicupin YhaK (pirin superfamily)
MTCGTGISHTEGNTANTPNRYLQLWIQPNVQDTEPGHAWHQFTREDKLNQFCDITAKLPIHQDARLLAAIFTDNFTFDINTNRHYYLYVVTGTAVINGQAVVEGDGLAFEQEAQIAITDTTESEIIVFDLV